MYRPTYRDRNGDPIEPVTSLGRLFFPYIPHYQTRPVRDPVPDPPDAPDESPNGAADAAFRA